MPNKTKAPIARDPETHSGAPVFTGTRIPVKVLFGYLPMASRWTPSWSTTPR